MLRNYDDLPEWCQKKIILASDYLGSVYHYMDFKIVIIILQSKTPNFPFVYR